MTREQILTTLDNSNDGFYCSFVELGHVYSYLIDARLNIFRSDDNRWAIAIERLGFNPRGGVIMLDIHYYGNCLINLEQYNNRDTSYYTVYPIDTDNFNETLDGEVLTPDADFWLVRGQQVQLSHNKQAYTNAGIELKEYQPDEISMEEAGRLVVIKHRDLFRATDSELYKSVPADLKKILVLDEWFHKDFYVPPARIMTDEQLRQTYESQRNMPGGVGESFESFAQSIRQSEKSQAEWSEKLRESNRPSSYETWQQLADVIISDDPKKYNPTLEPNTHWIHWQDSGSL